MITTKYPKINTLFKRDDKGKIQFVLKGEINFRTVIEHEYEYEYEVSDPVFHNIKNWTFSEKIDGTNVRIIFKDNTVTFGGRNLTEHDENFDMPKELYKYLINYFTPERLNNVFGNVNATLFGEGYGGNLQGKHYRDDYGFLLFDVFIEQEPPAKSLWLEINNVNDIASKLEINTPPIILVDKPLYFELLEVDTLPVVNIPDIIKLVLNGFDSIEAKKFNKEITAEGIVARASPMVLFRDGTPVMFKLKCRDFSHIKNRR